MIGLSHTICVWWVVFVEFWTLYINVIFNLESIKKKCKGKYIITLILYELIYMVITNTCNLNIDRFFIFKF